MKKNIVIDIDSTMTTDKSVFHLIKEYYNPSITEEEYETVGYDGSPYIKKGEIQRWLTSEETAYKYFHRFDELRPEVMDVLKNLKSEGHRLIIITHRGSHLRDMTLRFLGENSSLFEEMIFTNGSKSKKAREYFNGERYIAIDDNPKVVQDYGKCGFCEQVIKMKTHFNTYERYLKLHTVYGWDEVASLLLK